MSDDLITIHTALSYLEDQIDSGKEVFKSRPRISAVSYWALFKLFNAINRPIADFQIDIEFTNSEAILNSFTLCDNKYGGRPCGRIRVGFKRDTKLPYGLEESDATRHEANPTAMKYLLDKWFPEKTRARSSVVEQGT